MQIEGLWPQDTRGPEIRVAARYAWPQDTRATVFGCRNTKQAKAKVQSMCFDDTPGKEYIERLVWYNERSAGEGTSGQLFLGQCLLCEPIALAAC